MTRIDRRNSNRFSSNVNGHFAKLLLDATTAHDRWADVLEFIIENTPACAAIITLRDKETCQIVNDVSLEAEHHSPLIQGFSLETVGYYLTELRTIDPWAQVQRTNYPHHPMLMSTVCAPGSMPDNRFFKWLNGLGMWDTVVFDLDRMAGYWTACNLFLPNQDPDDARAMLDFANSHLPLLRSAWQSSQAIQNNQQASQALFEQIGASGRACALVGANGEFQNGNHKFQNLIETGVVRMVGPAKRLTFSHSVDIEGLEEWEDMPFARFDGSDQNVRVFARAVEPDPRFEGKREHHWLLEFTGFTSQETSDVYNLDNLTGRERRIFDAVASGASVKDAGIKVGLGRTRTFEIWNQVKSKLGISNAHKIR